MVTKKLLRVVTNLKLRNLVCIREHYPRHIRHTRRRSRTALIHQVLLRLVEQAIEIHRVSEFVKHTFTGVRKRRVPEPDCVEELAFGGVSEKDGDTAMVSVLIAVQNLHLHGVSLSIDLVLTWHLKVNFC
jgi:hypothetical protein